ncbi:MAG: hypothetical protein QNJ94_10905 [Alphaproteobacteria bacterium]|nr:hypothetical protein [Alphaproteobacteria bacterium]
MAQGLVLSAMEIARLEQHPEQELAGRINGTSWSVKVAIPNYGREITRHYGRDVHGTGVPFDFRHFGLKCRFADPVELALYDANGVLDEGVRELVRRFGPVIFSRAMLPSAHRDPGQRNVFSNLNFHYDRGAAQGNVISLFWRDPADPVQRHPRESSTLFLANAVAYLQSLKEGAAPHELKATYTLFEQEDIASLDGRILLELPWNEPEGNGEIAVLDNRTILHASYYREARGWPISVRYLY